MASETTDRPKGPHPGSVGTMIQQPPQETAGSPTKGLGRVLQSFHQRDFLLLWLGMLGSMVAMGMQMVAMGYLAYDLAGSATVLGVISMAWGFPQLLFSLVGGVVADRFPKRNLLILSQGVMGCVAVIMAVLVASGLIQIWHMVVLGFCQGTVFAFNMPARQALIPAIVGRENLANAIALNNAGMNMTRIVGPALAGFLIAVPAVGVAGVFYAMALCYVVALVLLFQIPAHRGGRGQALPGSMVQQVTAGVHYIRHSPPLLTLLAAAFAVVMLAMPHQTLLPLFALKVHQVGSEGLGMFNGLAGVGALVGSLVVAYMGNSSRKERLQLAAGLGFGASLVVFALAPSYFVALAAMFVVGAAGNVYMALNNTLVMMNTDSSMYGRVMSVYMMTFSLMPLSAFPMGMLADAIGAPWTVAGAGALTALAVAGTGLLSRKQAGGS